MRDALTQREIRFNFSDFSQSRQICNFYVIG